MLEGLEHPSVEAVHASERLLDVLEVPARERRRVVEHRPVRAREVVGEEVHALARQVAGELVHHHERRVDVGPQLLLGFRQRQPALDRPHRRERIERFIGNGGAELRIEGKALDGLGEFAGFTRLNQQGCSSVFQYVRDLIRRGVMHDRGYVIAESHAQKAGVAGGNCGHLRDE